VIGRIAGKLVAKHPPQILIDVHGIGYELDVPMSTLYQLPATGADVSLLTHLLVREDAHHLYGFATENERTLFRQLLKISGIGARTALAVLSGMSVGDLRDAVSRQEGGRLTKIPGIGKKTAERLLLELKDKLDIAVIEVRAETESAGSDVVNASTSGAVRPAKRPAHAFRMPARERARRVLIACRDRARRAP